MLPNLDAVKIPLDRLSVAEDSFIAPTAILRGNVTVGPRSSVWYHAILRGDLAPVVIGADTNVQDAAILHVEVDGPAQLGNRVTVGHAAIVHGAVVEDDCLIGIGARVLSGARIGRFSIIGASALVTEGTAIPERSLVLGIPGKVIRKVTDEEMERVRRNWAVYVEYAAQYRQRESGARG